MYIILTLSFKIQCNYKVTCELRQEFVFAGDKNFTHRLIITMNFKKDNDSSQCACPIGRGVNSVGETSIF